MENRLWINGQWPAPRGAGLIDVERAVGADLPFCMDNLKFFAGAARDTGGSHAGEYMQGTTSIYRKEPCEITAGIAPWNYPFMMAVRMPCARR